MQAKCKHVESFESFAFISIKFDDCKRDSITRDWPALQALISSKVFIYDSFQNSCQAYSFVNDI